MVAGPWFPGGDAGWRSLYMFIRSHYNYDVQQASDEAAYVETMPSLTVQSMSEDADLNVMLKRFGVTGKMPENVRLPQYGDFSQVSDFRSAMDAVLEAEENFMSLPAEVRAKFNNDPQLLLDFVSQPGNIEAVKSMFGEKNVSSIRDSSEATAAASKSVGDTVASGNGSPGANAPNVK